jgi:hypothetical protein
MQLRLAVLALALATPLSAETALDRAPGLYGSASNPAESCTTNPHELSFIESPPHALFRWSLPRPDRSGRMSGQDTYDLRGADDTTLTLQREGDAPLPETGRRPTWIFRLTETGYCWGRADWPLVRCVEPAIRCNNDSPTS